MMQIQCICHIIHLAVMELLVGLDAIKRISMCEDEIDEPGLTEADAEGLLGEGQTEDKILGKLDKQNEAEYGSMIKRVHILLLVLFP
jgi:hypothetical protein